MPTGRSLGQPRLAQAIQERVHQLRVKNGRASAYGRNRQAGLQPKQMRYRITRLAQPTELDQTNRMEAQRGRKRWPLPQGTRRPFESLVKAPGHQVGTP